MSLRWKSERVHFLMHCNTVDRMQLPVQEMNSDAVYDLQNCKESTVFLKSVSSLYDISRIFHSLLKVLGFGFQ